MSVQADTSRIALIINGASETGEALCARLAQLDYRVAIILPVDADMPRRTGMHAKTTLHEERCNVQDQVAVRRGIEAIERALGPVEILITDADVSYDLIAACGERMADRGWGRIIDIAVSLQIDAQQTESSVCDDHRQHDAKALALQLGQKGVTVNTIAPGHIGTSAGVAQLSQQAAGRLSLAEEIAVLAAYLVSDEAGFLNGANIAVNSGRRLA